ncbi:MAG: hypothetical protein COB67_02325 [SAR324 cluster bacterium]|uniref:Uncharacterized protein n=1 Tax=SAR324 cluster bacterium TaxID=2024889 RepID=A0A2A4T9W3_9DELT|nr:MAG: hypothetical protein COB67_02325 [SAR324 cluster bacterium]
MTNTNTLNTGFYAQNDNDTVMFIACEGTQEEIEIKANAMLLDDEYQEWVSFDGQKISSIAVSLLRDMRLGTYYTVKNNQVNPEKSNAVTPNELLLFERINQIIEDQHIAVKCNKCGWIGIEDELEHFGTGEDAFKGCKGCETDSYLMDIEEIETSNTGFYAQCDSDETPIFIAVKGSKDEINTQADDMLGNDTFHAWTSFEGKRLSIATFKLLRELTVSSYMMVMANENDPSGSSFYEITEKERSLFSQINQNIKDEKEPFLQKERHCNICCVETLFDENGYCEQCEHQQEQDFDTIKVNVNLNDNSSHMEIDQVLVDINEHDVQVIAHHLLDMSAEYICIPVTNSWLYKDQVSNEPIRYDELQVFQDGTMIVAGHGKHCGSEVQSDFFSIEKVTELLSQLKKQTITKVLELKKSEVNIDVINILEGIGADLTPADGKTYKWLFFTEELIKSANDDTDDDFEDPFKELFETFVNDVKMSGAKYVMIEG